MAVIVYKDEATAKQAYDEVKALQSEYLITLDDMAFVTKDAEGKLHVNGDTHPAALGALGGGFWGLLIGMLFFAPFLGLAIGAATGAAAGAMSDYGINDTFRNELNEKMKYNSSALFVLFRNAKPDKVVPEISKFGGEILKTSLSHDAEKRLQKELHKGARTAQ